MEINRLRLFISEGNIKMYGSKIPILIPLNLAEGYPSANERLRNNGLDENSNFHKHYNLINLDKIFQKSTLRCIIIKWQYLYVLSQCLLADEENEEHFYI
jgi:hypothetical protein